MAAVQDSDDSDTDETNDVLMIFDEVFTYFLYWILDSGCSYYVCYIEKLFVRALFNC